jgi:periplasmic divalent cation tolerance protein
MAAEPEFTVVLTTAGSSAEAGDIARSLVGHRLAACVNIVGPLTSVFHWDGELRQEEERLLIIKTRTAHLAALRDRILEVHSYDCPEIVELPVTGGFEPYLDWVRQATSRES